MSDPPTINYTLALDEARRGLDQQLADLHELRSRALNTLAIGGLVGAFFGGISEPTGGLTSSVLVAAFAFTGLVVTSLVVLWPRHLRFSTDPHTLIEWVADPAMTDPDRDRHLAAAYGDRYDENGKAIAQLMAWHTVGLGMLAVELGSLMANLYVTTL